jgi:hypothetical protein
MFLIVYIKVFLLYFRCTGGIQGLKDQGIINHIALKFITCYDQLFLEDGEISPNNPAFVLVSTLVCSDFYQLNHSTCILVMAF